jgi:hypothetical protein
MILSDCSLDARGPGWSRSRCGQEELLAGEASGVLSPFSGLLPGAPCGDRPVILKEGPTPAWATVQRTQPAPGFQPPGVFLLFLSTWGLRFSPNWSPVGCNGRGSRSNSRPEQGRKVCGKGQGRAAVLALALRLKARGRQKIMCKSVKTCSR